MPRLENMGVKVQSEVPYDLHLRGDGLPIRIRDFSLAAEGMQDDLRSVKGKFQEAFIRVWNKDAEDDGFNRLVLGAELEWHEVAILRAYCKYLRQIGVNLSEAYMQQTLAANTAIARLLIDLYRTNFDPALGSSALRAAVPESAAEMGRQAAATGIRAQIEEALGPAPVAIDELIRQTGAPVAAILTVLLELELAGRCVRHPGNRVSWA